MATFTFDRQPKLQFLDQSQILEIHKNALEILARAGMYFDCEEALAILEKAGCTVDWPQKIAHFPGDLVESCLRQVPETFALYDREGEPALVIGGDNCCFDPGSAGMYFLESDGITARPAVTADLVKVFRLADALEHFPLQSTALSLDDVPKEICDCFRVYLLMKHSKKPMAAGAFDVDGIGYIASLLAAVRGGEEALREKPLALIDICSSPSLKWTHISCRNIIDCVRFGLPIETISVPMPGAVSPATIAGSLLVHIAETLSGIVLAQSIRPGHPMVFGGAPMTFDMRYSTTSLNAVETNLISTSYAQMARYYGIPSHTYAALADPKVLDAQAGLETAFSGLLAVMGGVNVIAGPGMLDFVNTFSLEKLVVDHEIIAMAKRIKQGFAINEETMAVDLICELGPGGDYMSTDHTFQWFRKELFIPPDIIDKKKRNVWEAEGKRDIRERAREKVAAVLSGHESPALPEAAADRLDGVMVAIMEKMNVDRLPFGPEKEVQK